MIIKVTVGRASDESVKKVSRFGPGGGGRHRLSVRGLRFCLCKAQPRSLLGILVVLSVVKKGGGLDIVTGNKI